MKYNLTILLSGKTTPAKKKAFTVKLEKLLSVFEGKIDKTQDWGELPLAYKVKRETSGNFMHYDLELNPKAAKQLREKFVLENDILRYLLIRL